jgi:hypothetical protein
MTNPKPIEPDFDVNAIIDREIAACNARIAELKAKQQAAKQSVRVSIGWRGYNDRRYSKPWIALVTAWPVGGSPTLDFGGYVGNDSGGELEIMAKQGDIIRYGQKDYRKPRGSTCQFAVIEDDGTERDITDADARKLFNARTGGAS